MVLGTIHVQVFAELIKAQLYCSFGPPCSEKHSIKLKDKEQRVTTTSSYSGESIIKPSSLNCQLMLSNV